MWECRRPARRRGTSPVAVAVLRALLPGGATAQARGREVLRTLDLVRVSNRVLDAAGTLQPPLVRSLDAIHLAIAQMLGNDLGQLITYDDRMVDAAHELGLRTASPS